MNDLKLDFGIGIFITAIIVLGIIINYTGNEDKIIHIKNVTTISNGSGKTKYKVFAKEGVFENVDRLFIWKFNSSDLQNEMLVKKVCKVHLMGHRIPILSDYKNITKIYWCK